MIGLARSKLIPRNGATALLSIALSLGGCLAPIPRDEDHSGAVVEMLVRTELFFGMSRPGASDVTEADFSQFLRDEITPRFPQGFTVIDGHGQWREENGAIRTEPSRILIIIHPRQNGAEQKIEQIRRAYKSRFAQEAVLRTDQTERVSF